MNEILSCAEWLHTQITSATEPGDVHTRISGAYLDLIPEDADLPAVRFHPQYSTDVRGAANPAHRIMTQVDWLVAVVTKGNSVASLVPIAAALDQRLHLAQGTTQAVRILTCVRIEPFTLMERTDTGEHFRHAGGLYRTMIQAL